MFKDKLKRLRKERQITQQELAKQLNYGCTTISNYESGRNEPRIDDLIKLVDYFGVTLDYLVDREDAIRNFDFFDIQREIAENMMHDIDDYIVNKYSRGGVFNELL